MNPPNQLILDRLKFAANNYVTQAIIQQLEAHEYTDVLADRLMYSLTGEILAEKLVSEDCKAELRFPSSWWQHFKRDNCYLNLHRDRIMRWAAKRWPVRYTTHTATARFTRYHKYPEATIQMPELGQPVIFERWDGPWWDSRP